MSVAGKLGVACLVLWGVAALGEDHGSGSGPVERPRITEAEWIAESVKRIGEAQALQQKASPASLAFDLMARKCGSCHGSGGRQATRALLRLDEKGRPLDPGRITYERIMLAAVQNLGAIMPPSRVLTVPEKQILVDWLATQGVVPRNPRFMIR